MKLSAALLAPLLAIGCRSPGKSHPAPVSSSLPVTLASVAASATTPDAGAKDDDAPDDAPDAEAPDAEAKAPLPEEDPPEHLGTPASSLAANPHLKGERRPEYAPQSVNAYTLYEEAGALAAGAKAEALVCRFSVGDYRESSFTPGSAFADITVHLRFGQGKGRMNLEIDGPEDQNTIQFMLPLVSPAKGDGFVFDAEDRNIFTNDSLGRLQLFYRGTYPLKAHGHPAEITCRPVAREALERRFREEHGAFDAAVDALERLSPDGLHREWAMQADRAESMSRQAAEASLLALATLVGWDDPRVVRRVARLAASAKLLADKTSAQLDALRATLPAPADGPTPLADGAALVRTLAYTCGHDTPKKYGPWLDRYLHLDSDAPRCVLRLEVKNATDAPLQIGGSGGDLTDLTLLGRSGGVFDLELFAEERGGKVHELTSHTLAAGATIELIGAPATRTDGPTATAPLLLRALHRKAIGTAPAAGQTRMLGGAVTLHATKLGCDADAAHEVAVLAEEIFAPHVGGAPCVLHLEIKNEGSKPLAIETFFKHIGSMDELYLLGPSGKSGKLEMFGEMRDGTLNPLPHDPTLAVGEMIKFVFVSSKSEFPDAALPLEQLRFEGHFAETPSFARVE